MKAFRRQKHWDFEEIRDVGGGSQFEWIYAAS